MARRLLATVLVLLPAAAGRAADDPVPFRPSDFAWIPWAETVEEAAAKGKKEHKLVLAFVFPWDAQAFEAGYRQANTVREHRPLPVKEADAQRPRDPGFVKEQAALTAWLGHPDVAALVARSFVPVRLRMHTWHFFDGGPGPYPDPFPALGTTDRETRPPAVVVATPEGKLLLRVHRIGVFDPYVLQRTLLAVLRKNAGWRHGAPSPGADLRTAVAEAAAGGDLDGARRRLADAPAADAAWAAVAKARLDAAEGKVAEAEAALRALPSSTERDALLAEVLVRRGLFEEVAAMPGLTDDAAGRVALAVALERLGKVAEARALWRRALDEDPKGPRGARATLHLAPDGPLAAEWETFDAEAPDPLAATTISGAGGEARAVRYLLAQQRPDGSWRPPRWSPGLYDLSVARTALCVAALRAWKAAAPGPEDAAIARGAAYVHAFADKPSNEVWDLTYALHLEFELFADGATDDGRRRCGALIEGLSKIEHDGGWSYMVDSPRLHTFNTAPVLLLLVRAHELGLPVDPAQIGRASRFLERNRVPKGRVFHYGPTMESMSGQKGSTDEKSTCMRSPACELALLAAGASKDARGVAEALDLWFEHQDSARATQKIFESYTDTTSLQDSYRYFFGTWYAAESLARLPDAKRKKQAARLAAIVRAQQEIDGSFVDSQMVGKSSSTALALLALAAADRAAR